MRGDLKGSSDPSGTLGRGEIRARRFRVTFEYIDTLLDDIGSLIRSSDSRRAFPRILPDIPPDRRVVIEESITGIRERLARVMADQGIPEEPPSIPASRAIGCCLTAIHIALEELRAEGLAGDESQAAADTLRRDLSGLQEMVRELGRNIGEESAGGPGGSAAGMAPGDGDAGAERRARGGRLDKDAIG